LVPRGGSYGHNSINQTRFDQFSGTDEKRDKNEKKFSRRAACAVMKASSKIEKSIKKGVNI
jgi:hypothetical protein